MNNGDGKAGLPAAAKVLNMSALVDYQQGSIVSRTFIDRATGTVTLFAFDKGQGLSEHTAPFDAMVQIVDGDAEIIIAGKPFRLTRGEAIIMPGGQPHAVKALQQFKMLLTMIKS